MKALVHTLEWILGAVMSISGPLMLILGYAVSPLTTTGTALMFISGIYVTVSGFLLLPVTRKGLANNFDIHVNAGLLAVLTFLGIAALLFAGNTYLKAVNTVFL